jgi:subtilisin family serine protease
VLTLAAMGNDNLNLADDAALTNAFGVSGVVEVPGGLPGVVGVSSTGYSNDKSFFSNYGLGNADVSAPGGDSVFQASPSPYGGGGRVLGAWSSTSTLPADEQPPTTTDGPAPYAWAWEQGTSMATPNAAGVAALIVSRYGDFSPWGRSHAQPDQVERILEGSAAPQSCPNPSTVVYGIGGSVSDPSSPDYDPSSDYFSQYFQAVCQGRPGNNGFFGNGIVDAVAALTGNVHR